VRNLPRIRPSGFGFALCILGGLLASATPADTIAIKDFNGVARSVPEKKSRATTLFFVTTDCPIANSYAPEINRICAQYEREKIAFYIVYTDPTISLAAQRKHAKEYGYRCPAIRDAKHALVMQAKATVTPEAAILSPEGKLLYRGRIDDRYLDFGKKRTHPTTRDLRDALDAVARGKPVPNPTTKAIGCFIPTEK
jgi:hypothetical protein